MVAGMEDMKRELANATGLNETTLAATRRDAMENMIYNMNICSKKYIYICLARAECYVWSSASSRRSQKNVKKWLLHTS